MNFVPFREYRKGDSDSESNKRVYDKWGMERTIDGAKVAE
jgi:hypothetical protein